MSTTPPISPSPSMYLTMSHLPRPPAGLNIVKQLVNSHDGTITVDSTEGVGTIFTIHLPALQRCARPSIEQQVGAGQERGCDWGMGEGGWCEGTGTLPQPSPAHGERVYVGQEYRAEHAWHECAWLQRMASDMPKHCLLTHTVPL